MIIYNILIGLLTILLIYAVVLIIQNYTSNPHPVNPPPSPVEPVKPHKQPPVNPPRPINPPPRPINPPRPVNPPPGPVNPPAPPVLPSSTSTWTQDNIIELDSYLRNFFINLFQLHTVPQREPIKDDTYKYIEEAIMDKYSYNEYKTIFLDFSNIEYIGYYNDTNWKNKTFKPISIPSDNNINLALFILQNLDKYQPLTKISFENIFEIQFNDIWKDKTQQIADCIYNISLKYNITPTSYLFLTSLMGNINMSINYNKNSYPKDADIPKVISDFINNQQDPILDYCDPKLGV